MTPEQQTLINLLTLRGLAEQAQQAVAGEWIALQNDDSIVAALAATMEAM